MGTSTGRITKNGWFGSASGGDRFLSNDYAERWQYLVQAILKSQVLALWGESPKESIQSVGCQPVFQSVFPPYKFWFQRVENEYKQSPDCFLVTWPLSVRMIYEITSFSALLSFCSLDLRGVMTVRIQEGHSWWIGDTDPNFRI